MTRHAILPALLILFATTSLVLAAEVTVEELPGGFSLTGPRLAITVQGGIITGARSVVTGEVHADPATADLNLPAGMGHLEPNRAAAMALHGPWGTTDLGQNYAAGVFPSQRRPHEGSRFTLERTEDGALGTWIGLTNGAEQFPDDRLVVGVRVDDSGGTLVQAWGESAEGGVYGVQVPVANLHPDHRVYSTSFGGMMYENTMPPALRTLGGAPFIEAPVLAVEGRQSTLGLWTEDERFHPWFCLINWSGTSWAVALEHLNLMPFEPHRSTESVVWHLDAFAGGWVDAMTPYRDWYRDLFAEEFAIRDGVEWADRIQIIVDAVTENAETYAALAATFDPETILIHEWNAREPSFTGELPAMEPKPHYPAQVALAHRYGFRTMAYCNSYCAEKGCPAYVESNLEEVALVRRYRGFSRYDQGPLSWDSYEDGTLVYTDPLAPGWRADHIARMKQWRLDTGTDANYEDTAGACGDYGNGVVEGLQGAQGTVALFKELLRAQPDVPMSSEYGPEPMAFATRWPLHFQQVWGNDAARAFWLSHMRPVGAFLFGHRSWTPNIRAENNFLHHVILGCSDALGGVAQFPGDLKSLSATRGALVQMRQRAQLFSGRQLQPSFPTGRWEPDLACVYTDDAGRTYRYYANAQVHRMVGPDGAALYERVTGRTRFATALTLPGWPAATAEGLIGLNPAVRYALVPGAHDTAPIQVTALPDDAMIARYYGDERFTVLAIAAANEAGSAGGAITAIANLRTPAVTLNDEPVAAPAWPEGATASEPTTWTATALPARFVCAHTAPTRPGWGEFFATDIARTRWVDVQTGLDAGARTPRDLSRQFEVPGEGSVLFRFLNGGGEAEVILDYLVTPPAGEAVLEVFTRNTQQTYGNGSIGRLYINGRLVHEHDFGPRPVEGQEGPAWDLDLHRWRVPVRVAPGVPVLVSIATDSKASNNADEQWWSAPRFVEGPMEESFVRFRAGEALPE